MAIVMALVSSVIVGLLLRKFRKMNPDQPFQVRITDLWAFILALTPGCYWCSQNAKSPAMPIVLTMMIGQAVGGFWFHLMNEEGPESSKKDGLGAAINIFVGTIFGVALPIVIVFGAIVCLRLPYLAYEIFTAENGEHPRSARRKNDAKCHV